jgi:protein tyrosine phosphatase
MKPETDDPLVFVNDLFYIVKGEVPGTNTPGKLFTSRMWWGDSEKLKIEQFLAKNNITAILNLLEDSHGNLGPAEEVWSPINDFSIPSNQSAFLKAIDNIVERLKSGSHVLAHCYAGHGRTGIAVATILWRLGHSKKEALVLAKQATSGPERQIQVDFVLGL